MTDTYNFISRSGLWLKQGGTDLELTERIAELEQDDIGWLPLAGSSDAEFSRNGLAYFTRSARLFYLKNPLVNRAITVKSDYVFGRSVSVTAQNEEIEEVIQQFWTDKRNQAEFTAHQAMVQKEVELECDGNIFWAFLIHPITGRVRVRTIPVEEITDIITNPQDKKEPWYYLREWTETTISDKDGSKITSRKKAYYPDWEYKPSGGYRAKIGLIEVQPIPIFHTKIGGFSDWKFGVPELFSALDWAKAYTVFLENWSSLVASYARFAFILSTPGGEQGIAAAKSTVGTTLGVTGTGYERNPAPVTGSTLVTSKNAQGQPNITLDAVKTSGATTSAADGRFLQLMVAAGSGFPETFFGNADVGNHATAQTLDRPTELGIMNRQALWTSIYHQILEYVVFWAMRAPKGRLRGLGEIIPNEYGEEVIQFDEDVEAHIDIDFPPVTEHSLQEYVDAVVKAAPYLNDGRLLAKLLLTALGENDIDKILDMLFPETPEGAEEEEETIALADELAQAAQEVRRAMQQLGIQLRESVNTYKPVNGNGVAR